VQQSGTIISHNLGSISKEAVVVPVKGKQWRKTRQAQPWYIKRLVSWHKERYLQQKGSTNRPSQLRLYQPYIWLNVSAFVKMLRNSLALKWRSVCVSYEDVFDLLFCF